MTNISKKAHLILRKNLLLHTIDFLINDYTGYFVIDEYDSQKEYYQEEKKNVEKYFAEGNLQKLNALINKFHKLLYAKRDEKYLREMESVHGIQVGLYKQLSINIQKIFMQNEILNDDEALDVELLINIYKTTTNRKYDVDSLIQFLKIYRLKSKNNIRKSILQTETNYSTTHFLDSSMKRNLKRIFSQDGKHWLEINKSGKAENELTYIVAGVDGSNGPIYSVKGKGEDIRCSWADNNTITINTSSVYEIIKESKSLQTKHSKISINYTFNE